MNKQTQTGEWKIKERDPVIWYEPAKTRRGEQLLKNIGVASALVICAVMLKSGALPVASDMTDAVLASVTDDTLLDDRLGKLSFVSSIFPEATLVFGESNGKELCMPVNGGTVVHAWNQAEPYMTWRSGQMEVFSAGDGVVTGVYHGENEERIIHIMGENGLSCLYGNIKEAAVQMGDQVAAGDTLGLLLDGEDCVFEVRQDGISVDPADYLQNIT